MSKRIDPNEPFHWIIYYDEGSPHGQPIKMVKLGDKKIGTLHGNVLTSYDGTKAEAKAKVARMNETFVLKRKKIYAERKRKNESD